MENSYKPPKLIGNWIRCFLGLGVGVGVGLAPYLGMLNVPFFRPLLELIPLTDQSTLIPLSSALMGVIAAGVQWYGSEKINRKYLSKFFFKTLLFCIISFFILTVVHTIFVVKIPIKSGQESVSFLVGYARPFVEPCPEYISDEACIELLSFDPSEISSFWGNRQIRVARLLLFGIYLFFTCSFAVVVSLIVIKEKNIKPKRNDKSRIQNKQPQEMPRKEEIEISQAKS